MIDRTQGQDEDARRAVAEGTLAVLANDWVNGEYKHLALAAAAPMTLARPGQFFQLLCPKAAGAGAPFLRRPMSTYRADPQAGRLEFLYKVTGSGTRALATLRQGDSLDVLGPLGRGFRLDRAWRHIAVIGRGVGLATLAPLAEAAAGLGIGMTAILSARRADLVMSVDRFAAAGADVVSVHDEDGSSAPQQVAAILDGLIATDRADAFFTCGSERLLRLVQRYGDTHRIPCQVALEQQMACGLGMCFCCVRAFRSDKAISHRRVCCDGPVFDLQEAASC